MVEKKKTKGFSLCSWFPWLLWAVALILSFVWMGQGRSFWKSYLTWVVLFNGGIQGLWGALGNLVYPSRTAKKCGVQPCVFQTVVGAADLSLGIMGILSFFYASWLLPVALVIAIFYAGRVFAHVKESRTSRTASGCCCGPMVWNTAAVSLTLFLAAIIVGTTGSFMCH